MGIHCAVQTDVLKFKQIKGLSFFVANSISIKKWIVFIIPLINATLIYQFIFLSLLKQTTLELGNWLFILSRSFIRLSFNACKYLQSYIREICLQLW
jgi:hypothetical protein